MSNTLTINTTLRLDLPPDLPPPPPDPEPDPPPAPNPPPPAPGPSDGTSTFTVTAWPPNPFIGEVLRVHIEGSGGHVAPSPMQGTQDDLLDIWVETDVGEPGATFEAAPSYNAEVAPGRYFGHAYASAGTKELTINSWTFGGSILQQSVQVTVVDPDAYAWDRVLWVDLTGNTTGMPAPDATNIRVLSWAQWLATRNGYAGLDVRIRFRGGETHTLTPVDPARDNWQSKASLVYIDSFGTGKATIRGDMENVIENYDFFKTGASGQRVIACNLRFDGGYDIVSGFLPRGRLSAFRISSTVNAALSVYKCEARGIKNFLIGAGTSPEDNRYRPAMFDCVSIDLQNYTFFSGPSNDVMIRGNRCIQPLNTGRGDTQTGLQNDFADHAPIRIPRFIRVGIQQNDLRNFGGWSTGGSEDKAGQPAIRLYFNDNEPGTKAVIINNRTMARSFVAWGRATVRTQTMTHPAQVLMVANRHRAFSQGYDFVDSTGGGGIFAYSNTFYKPDLATDNSENQPFSMVRYQDLTTRDNVAPSSAAVINEPSCIGFNTMVTDLTAARNQWSKGNSNIAQTIINDGATTINNVTVLTGQIAGDGMSNSGSLLPGTAFSRPTLRPITGSAADTTVSSGARPPVDVEMGYRSGATGRGAWHTAAANTTPANPVNSVAPTLGQLTGWSPARYGITDIGTWSNIDDWTGIEFRYLLNGSEFEDTHVTNIQDNALSGNLQCQVTLVGPSGVRVTANTNTVAI